MPLPITRGMLYRLARDYLREHPDVHLVPTSVGNALVQIESGPRTNVQLLNHVVPTTGEDDGRSVSPRAHRLAYALLTDSIGAPLPDFVTMLEAAIEARRDDA